MGHVSPQSKATPAEDGYVVRRYEPADRDQFLDLYEEVFEKARTPEWFNWRYGGPHTDEVRMFLAEKDGEIVGAEPFISFEICGGGETVSALQPADAMVHPDHRRNGLLTRITEAAIDHYTDAGPSFIFNFPNQAAIGAFLKLGWVQVGEVATAYRIQKPSAFLKSDRAKRMGPLADAFSAAGYRARDAATLAAARRRSDDEVTVTRHADIPSKRLAALYESAVSPRLHAPRTEAFYDWRFANPQWDTVAYTAKREGELVASIVTCTQASHGITTTKILDALPIVDAEAESEAFDRLLRVAIDDHDYVDTVAVAEDTIPPTVLSRLNFFRNDRFPMSIRGSPTPVVARPLVPEDETQWTVGGRHLADRADWCLSFAEQDTSV
ncbi:GNAT family N-acetyltransferase [Haloprofundus salilacus]|uniref:GNAT family N-acetyltransferase n=1 Tax=Haloprofundus salilacus TaxID=2876190 RepID=UPI001CCC023B|nr:GNAT family N-acetyltransferase [Haloprofundus salilacus]